MLYALLASEFGERRPQLTAEQATPFYDEKAAYRRLTSRFMAALSLSLPYHDAHI